MPYVHMSIAKKLSDEQKESIKTSIGQLIEILPNKSEKVLMIRLDDDLQMYFRGVKENCAYVNVCLYMTSPDQKKGEFGSAFAASLSQLAGIDQSNIFLSFSEFGNWFSGGVFK
jgi:phenylpyruvate tautomerase PptA (4-oxalocrotonate tautomerase family)